MVKERRLSTWHYLMLLALLCLLSRLPQLLSRNLMVDGDEAVVGLMARHLLISHEVPLFFWGQHYGLATVEAAFAAAAFGLAGVGPIALKLSMLALWAIGVGFLFLAISNLIGQRRAFWLAVVFILTPVWAIWSMKARGGYLTAFTSSSALLWLTTFDRERQRVWMWIVAGMLTAVIYLAQPLWLPGLLPIVAVGLIRRKSVVCAAGYAGVIAATVLLVPTSTDASAGPVFGNVDVFGSVPLMGRQIFQFMTGWFDMWWIPPMSPGPVTMALGLFWCGVLVVCAGLQVYRLATRHFLLWSHLLFAAITITLLSELLSMHARDARYLLPLGALMVLLGGLEVSDLLDRQLLLKSVVRAGVVALVVLGAVSLREFKEFSFLWVNPPTSFSETERLRRLLAYLQVEGATRVFSMNGLLDTQLVFYANEHVIARSQYLNARQPAYVDEVDRALNAGERVAVVGFTNTSGAPGCRDVPICTGGIEGLVSNPEQIYTIDGKYFAYVGASRDLLERLRFRFPEGGLR